MILLKSILHNLGVLFVGVCFGLVGVGIDHLLYIHEFASLPLRVCAVGSLLMGFFIRLWATAQFYEHHMRVIKLSAQSTLLTTGAYALSRNPLYLGGNVFIFLGAVLWFGSASGLVLIVVELFITDRFIHREERQLEQAFGEEWLRYKATVRRWI